MEARARRRDHRGRAAARLPEQPIRRAPAGLRARGERRPAPAGPIPPRGDGRAERSRASPRRVPPRQGRRRAHRGGRDGPHGAHGPAERAASRGPGRHGRGPTDPGGGRAGDGGPRGRGRRDGPAQRRRARHAVDAGVRDRPVHGHDRPRRVAARRAGPELPAPEPGDPEPVRPGLDLQAPRRRCGPPGGHAHAGRPRAVQRRVPPGQRHLQGLEGGRPRPGGHASRDRAVVQHLLLPGRPQDHRPRHRALRPGLRVRPAHRHRAAGREARSGPRRAARAPRRLAPGRDREHVDRPGRGAGHADAGRALHGRDRQRRRALAPAPRAAR